MLDTIMARKSIRAYSPEPIPQDTLDRLNEIISIVRCGPYGSSLRFSLVKRPCSTFQTVRGHQYTIVGAAKTTKGGDDFFSVIDYGYAMEKIILSAQELDLSTCWLGGFYHTSEAAKMIDLQSDEKIYAVSPLGIAKRKQDMSCLERILSFCLRKMDGADKRLDASRMFFNERFGSPITPEISGKFSPCLQAVRWAPSASNGQPWRIVLRQSDKNGEAQKKWCFFRVSWFRFYSKLDAGICMCHWEVATSALGLPGSWKVPLTEKDMKEVHAECGAPKEAELFAVWVQGV